METALKPIPSKSERIRWKELQEENEKRITEPKGVGMFLALADDECHELVVGSHSRWRTPLEHDVLLPQSMKDQGVPYTPSWNGEDPLPGQVAIRLKAGSSPYPVTAQQSILDIPCLSVNAIRYPSVGRSGAVPPRRNRRSLMRDSHGSLDPAVREALPHEWMKTAWDRWAANHKLGDRLEDRYAGFDIERIKAGEVVGWRTELERQAAAAGR